jgi:hypothetical protein
MLQQPPLSLTVMTKNLSPDNLAILGTHYIKELLMKRGKRENLVGNPPPPQKKKRKKMLSGQKRPTQLSPPLQA